MISMWMQHLQATGIRKLLSRIPILYDPNLDLACQMLIVPSLGHSETSMSGKESMHLAISAAASKVFHLMDLPQEMTKHGCGLAAMSPSLPC